MAPPGSMGHSMDCSSMVGKALPGRSYSGMGSNRLRMVHKGHMDRNMGCSILRTGRMDRSILRMDHMVRSMVHKGYKGRNMGCMGCMDRSKVHMGCMDHNMVHKGCMVRSKGYMGCMDRNKVRMGRSILHMDHMDCSKVHMGYMVRNKAHMGCNTVHTVHKVRNMGYMARKDCSNLADNKARIQEHMGSIPLGMGSMEPPDSTLSGKVHTLAGSTLVDSRHCHSMDSPSMGNQCRTVYRNSRSR